ncbi:MAG: GTP-binding protein [Desulfovibrio sp.]|jgi:small GTP-binding protein|nr:GTP-binding protein [Desulfovibrio sp.]
MISKKICMLGSFSVGKTALVARYVHSIFSDKYLSTVGVKISKKNVSSGGKDFSLILWDLEGKDLYADVNLSYLRGAMGFFTVADGTRKETLEAALELRKAAHDTVGQIPGYLLINKEDLSDAWEVTDAMLDNLTRQGIKYFRTSAKTGLAVEEAFTSLARDMLQNA